LDALFGNANGQGNVAIGRSALQNASTDGNTAVGRYTLEYATGQFNVALGQNAGVALHTGDVNILIGNGGVDGESNTTRLGTEGNQTRTFISGIRNVTTGAANGLNVVIDSNGQLGTASSSRRYKEDIADMGEASHDLLRLRPVTFRYTKPYEHGSKPVDYGLIAEEVAEVYPDLVVRGNEGRIESVQYQKLTPMLLNELQKLRHEADADHGQLAAARQRLDEDHLALESAEREIRILKSALAEVLALVQH
jgi:hypothetical protein